MPGGVLSPKYDACPVWADVPAEAETDGGRRPRQSAGGIPMSVSVTARTLASREPAVRPA